MERYVIKRQEEEDFCQYCGWELVIDDYVYLDGIHLFCSRGCAREYEMRTRARHIAQIRFQEEAKRVASKAV